MENYLKEKVNPIIKELIKDILENRKENVVEYMKEWCDKKGLEIEREMKERK